MNRRQFTLLTFASFMTASIRATDERIASRQNKLFSAFDANEKHFVGRVNIDTELDSSSNIDSIQIPFRAHDTLPLSEDKSISFGRRPNNQMVVCDFKSKQQKIVNASIDRHFYGHGCIDQSRKTLFSTENDYENKKGVIGIRDSRNLQQIGEYDSYGIGPHDIHLMPDNKMLVVANGGIHTHPDYGRRKLNLKTMQSSLVFIDLDSGKKIDEYRLPNHKLSIRHLSVNIDASIAVATQYQGKLNQNIPDHLLAVFGKDGLQTLKDSQQFTRHCKGYIADVVTDDNNQILAATSPRGNLLSLWDTKKTRLIKTIQISGPSGLCFNSRNQEFLVSNDKGVIYKIALNSPQLLATQLQVFPVKWDNHMTIHV